MPPAAQVGVGRGAQKLFLWDAQQVLVSQPVEGGTLLHVAFVLQGGFRLVSGPSQTLHVAELEPARAVGVILEAGLAELKVGGQRLGIGYWVLGGWGCHSAALRAGDEAVEQAGYYHKGHKGHKEHKGKAMNIRRDW